MKKPKVFVIILNYNGQDTLRECLNSVLRSDYVEQEIVLIDNRSTDDSFRQARQDFSRIYFIENSKNLGFAAGVNVGIRLAMEKMADYVLLLNNDARLETDTLSKLVESLEQDPSIGLASPLILQEASDKVWFAGGRIDWLKMRTIHTAGPSDRSAAYDTEYLSGCALLIRKEVFQKIGLFDEKFFFYYEDADFSWRAGQAGYRCQVVPTAIARHREKSSANPKFKTYWLVISALVFFRKNSSRLIRLWQAAYLLARKLKNRIDLNDTRKTLAPTVAKAYKDYAQWIG